MTPAASDYSTILEYQLPMEHRRPDVVLLLRDGVLVLELKSKSRADLADLDQAGAYARDLLAYHRDCDGRTVWPALVLMHARGRLGEKAGVEVLGPDAVDSLIAQYDVAGALGPIDRDSFLDPEAYRPLPTLVKAARALMETGHLPRIKRPDTETGPTLAFLKELAINAAATRSRHLVLITGLPGTGKTLVGLQLAHAGYLDELAVPRAGKAPTTPAVYLSGNGPLVEVLQYELRKAGGGGATFVRGVKAYVERYSSGRDLVPPEHVLIFDEAQRAFDAATVDSTHKEMSAGKSEPEHFVEFAERVPEWCVVVGLIGSGQEIHVGEEGGVVQWRDAIARSSDPGQWTVHCPPTLSPAFEGVTIQSDARLELTAQLRYHLADEVNTFVSCLLGETTGDAATVASSLEAARYHLRITRDLDVAKKYLRDRFASDPDSRYGLIASSRDKCLWEFGVPNDFRSTQRVSYGPWFVEGDDDPRGRSCRSLRTCATEFKCQGLELDAALLAWGSDFVRQDGSWSNAHARRYQRGTSVHDALQLRTNAYRVLLTRGRDGVTVFIPPIPMLDETFDFLRRAGFTEL